MRARHRARGECETRVVRAYGGGSFPLFAVGGSSVASRLIAALGLVAEFHRAGVEVVCVYVTGTCECTRAGLRLAVGRRMHGGAGIIICWAAVARQEEQHLGCYMR